MIENTFAPVEPIKNAVSRIASNLCEFNVRASEGGYVQAIHVLVPRTEYDRLLERCDRAQAVYEHLVNGIVEKDDKGQEQVRIFCDELREREIYEFIREIDPQIMLFISRVVFTLGDKQYNRRIA